MAKQPAKPRKKTTRKKTPAPRRRKTCRVSLSVDERKTPPAPEPQTEQDKGGRPIIQLDWEKIANLCWIQCTGPEIASVLDIDQDTLTNACKRDHGMTFKEWAANKRQGGKASLRRYQWKAAQGGDRTMLVWLGKNMLGQSDKMENRVKADFTVDDRRAMVRAGAENPKVRAFMSKVLKMISED